MRTKDLTVGDPAKVLRSFCLPLFGSVLFQQLYNLADSFVAGKCIGQSALAAVGNSYEITMIFLAFGFGCNIGCSVVVSGFFGGKRYREMKTAVTTTVLATAVLCLLLMGIGFLTQTALLTWLKTPQELFADSKLYLEIYMLGLPFVFFYNISSGIFSAMGDSKTPLLFLAASSCSNIAVDLLFVTTFRMGVAGVAWATFLCQGVSCLLSLWVVFRKLKRIPTEGKTPLFSGSILCKIAKIAVPSILQQSFVSVGNIVIQRFINGFGKSVMAGYSASVKLNNLVITTLSTIGTGVSNYTAQNLGAGKPRRIAPGFAAGCKFVFCICLPITLLYLFAGETLVQLFLNRDDSTAAAIETGRRFLRILAPFYCVISLKLMADGILRGAGRMSLFMTDTFADLLLRVVLAFFLSRTALGSTGIWCAWPIGWVLSTGLALYFCFLQIRSYRSFGEATPPQPS